ncbi:ligand-binding sensor domain-containing protein [Flammeovirga kamogawensis]|uniref:HTH luxR-type domain-containing protein n=1 Tax=Flammeovirga kamogawensis TaxID=373891 RepID=A0ABX8H0M1_9BACT|nr:two-component regulator propeller domain-containing protein [Flammeovirga kamogawensis]MBB6459313.1 ligand-binding sensor domain-containing protein/DNA-binding CsgD family transcriptional regulator [Flammeovirga kamogawensis]QWG08872.1 hypothetical protein KM029_08000 [Flammeovirga kamogawensis]TRX67162.1 hypothetical protein EO216_03045 [Flammeovirga kamogawensis]
MKTTLLSIFLTIYCGITFCQQLSQLPKIRNFQKNEYKALPQSWAIVQDNKGIIYFGNNDGLLQFDGENWTIYPLPNKSIVRSILFKNDTIYVGGQGEIGYFSLKGDNTLIYHSLSNQLHKIDFEDVWNIVEDKDGGVVFHSQQNDYQYKGNVLTKIPHHEGEYLFRVKHLLISSEDHLLKEFNFDVPIRSIQVNSDGHFLLFSRDKGIYLYNHKEIKKWHNKTLQVIQKAGIYSVIPLSTSGNVKHYAIGSVKNGVFIINENGKIVSHYNKENGLANNTVLAMYQDRDNELWCGLDNGISKIDLFSPVSYYSDNINFNPSVYSAQFYKSNYYIGTNQGVFKRSKKGINHSKVKGIEEQIWKIFIWNEQLYVAHNHGLSILKNDIFQPIFTLEGVWDGQILLSNTNYLLIGTYKGFRLVDKKHNVSDIIEGLDVTARIFVQLDNHEIWMSHGYKGVYKCILSQDQKSFSTVEFYNSSNGLPSSIFNNVFKVKDELFVGALHGIFTYNNDRNKFEITNDINGINSTDTTHIKYLKMDNSERLWMLSNLNFTISNNEDNLVLNNFIGNFVAGFEFVKEQSKNEFIIGLEEGYAVLSIDSYKKPILPLETLISTIQVGDKTEHLRTSSKERRTTKIPFDKNQITFNFTNPYYKNLDYNQYRYYLKGFEKDWSEWSTKNAKTYSFLNEGKYSFLVQSRNVNNALSNITTYSFEITPPWYRSTFAYILYLIAFVSFFLFTILFLKHRAKREKRYLMLKQTNDMHELEYKLMKEVTSSQEEIVKLKNEKLKTEINSKNEELAAVTMAIMQKNQGLQSIKEKLQDKYNTSKDRDIRQIIKKIDEATDVENDWDEFSIRFDQVYDNFFEKLKSKYPALTHRDIQICAYLKMKLTSKEIANTLNITVRSVEQSRYRLRKKMNLSHEENLLDKILSI